MKKNSKSINNHEVKNNKDTKEHESIKEHSTKNKEKSSQHHHNDQNNKSKNHFANNDLNDQITNDPKLKNSEKKSDKYKKIIKSLETEKEQLQKQITNLQSQNFAAKIENQKNIHDFQLKAKEFQNKAQAEIDKIKEQLHQKMLEEKQIIEKYSLQKFFEHILKPFTSLMTAINFGQKSADKNVKEYVFGFKMYMKQLVDEFSHFGVSQILPQVGEDFNEQIHEISETVAGKQKNVIIEVLQNGFKLHDRVLIPALVIVGK